MNLDNRALALLALQLLVLTGVCAGAQMFPGKPAIKVWAIRVVIAAALGLAALSQLPVSQGVQSRRPIMLSPTFLAEGPVFKPVKVAKGRADLASTTHDKNRTLPLAEIWAIGAVCGAAWLVSNAYALRRLRLSSSFDAKVDGVEVRRSPLVASPFVAGVFRSVIYMPDRSDGGVDEHAVIAHELAHIEHGDLYWKAAHSFLCVLLWPCLFLWLLRKPHDRAMEDLADAKAALASPSAAQYADLLLGLAEHRARLAGALALSMKPKRSSLGRRIRRILTEKQLDDVQPIRPSKRILIGGATILFSALLVSGFGWERASKTQVPAPMSGKVQVHFVGANGKGAKGLKVWLRNWAADEFTPVFRALDVPKGLVDVDLSVYSKLDAPMLLASDDAGDVGSVYLDGSKKDIEIHLVPTTTLSGRLMRPNGEPEASTAVAGTVIIFDQGSDGRPPTSMVVTGSPLEMRTATDANGNFELTGVPENCILQIALKDPTVQQPIPKVKKGNGWTWGIQVGNGPTDVGQMALKDAAMVSGRLTLNGKGLAGIRIGAQIVSSSIDSDASSWSDTITDQNGDYVLGGLGDSTYNVMVFLPSSLQADYACAAKDSLRTQVGHTIAGQDFALAPGGVVEGDVVLKDGANSDGYTIAYYGPDRPQGGAACGSAHCDANGHFKFHVSPGKQFVYMMATARGPHMVSQTVDVRDGQTVHLTLKED